VCCTISGISRSCPCVQGELPEWIRTPAGVAIPFGAFEAVLQDEVNADVSVEFVKLAGFGGTADANLANLQSIRAAIERLREPESLRTQLREAFQAEGMHGYK
jgi:alpha-glucan,water dikinase